MKCTILRAPSEQDWMDVKQCGLVTMGKKAVNPPDDVYKAKLIKSEHSPLTTLSVRWRWDDIPYFVSVHLVRHHIGITHFVTSQRNDRQDKYDRTKAPQDSPVSHECVANYLEIINISRKRMCGKADKNTRHVWLMFLNELRRYEPLLVDACVPNCVYRGGLCPEFEPCSDEQSRDLLMVCYPQYKKFMNLK